MDTPKSKPSAQGTLFSYNSSHSICYKSQINSKKFLLFLDGMWGNILSIPYFYPLKKLCDDNNIVLVYPQLRSHPYFNIHRIQEDVEDIASLVGMLDGDVVLLGHSTGCQDSLLYIREHQCGKVKGIVLQAPVSDIQARPDPLIKQLVVKAKENTEELFITYNGQTWLKERFVTVLEPYNKQDLFSSYLQQSEFEKWKTISPVPILSVLGLKDEYCGKDLSHKFKHMGKVEVLENASHAIKDPEDQVKFISIVECFLREINFI